jgi:flagellar biosynthesis GTPase FlhF
MNHTRNRSSTLGREAILRNARKHSPPGSENGSATPNKAEASDTDLSRTESGRARGKTISFDRSRGSEAKGEGMDVPRDEEDCECNPIEWIMITRSDPGGSVPRFMVERGTPGGIVSDASKFLNWACAKDIEDFDSDDETEDGEHMHKHNHEKDLHNYQTNGHLAGLEEEPSVNGAVSEQDSSETVKQNGSGYYGMVTGAATAAGEMIAAHTPQVITNNLPGHVVEQNGSARRESVSSISSASSSASFASALENADEEPYNDASSTKTTESQVLSRETALKDKELQKLEDRKRKLDEKLSKAREKEMSKKSEDSAKEEEALRKAQEKHEQEVKKQEEKYRREVEKLEQKRKKEEKKVEERKRKATEKDEKTRLLRELEELKAEVGVLKKERQIMNEQVGALQAENTALAAKVGRMGLLEIKDEVGKTGRARANSLKGVTRASSFKTTSSGEKDKEN